jgi:hypothetical protein
MLHQVLLQRSNQEDEVGGACSMHGMGGSLHNVLVGKPEGKEPLIRPRHRLEEWLLGK